MKVSKEFKVGLFMVVAIALLYFGFNFLKGKDFFSSSNKYYAIYQNVDGLTESNQIFINGYAVGRVSGITIQQMKNRVIVELDIQSDIIVTDSSVAMLNGALLGGRFIQLEMRGIGRKLNPKDTITSEVAKGLMDFVTQNAEPVADMMQNLNKILADLARNTSRLDSLFIKLETTPDLLNGTLRTARGSMADLSSSLKDISLKAGATLEQLQPTLANFHTLSDSLKVLRLNGTMEKAEQSLASLNKTLALLSAGDNTASKLLTEDSLYNNLNTLLLSLDTLAKHFNENPKHFLSPLGKSKKKIEKELARQRKDN
jgi:phospholipid/cholesterol/gamma-HCH transport system substrate-binding protein